MGKRAGSALLALLLVVACTSKEERAAAYRARAEAYVEAEQWSEAKIELLNLLQLAPNDAAAHYRLGNTQWSLDEYSEALWQFREAVRLAPENIEYRMRLAAVLFLARDYDGVEEQLSTLLEQAPEHVPALILRARAARVEGELDRELEVLERALEIDPQNVAALAMKAQALAARGTPDEAELVLHQLVRVDPSPSSHQLYGAFLSLHERVDEARAQFEAAVEAAHELQDRIRALQILANFHLGRGEMEAAEAQLLRAREEAPEDQRIRLTLAQFYAVQGERERAREMLEERVRKQPDAVGPLLVLADFHFRLDERDEALRAVERALVVDPNSEAARLRKAQYLLVLDEGAADSARGEEARALVEGVLEENPSSLLGIFVEAKLLMSERHYDEAVKRLRAVIEEQPSANAHVLLGTAYFELGQRELARSEFLKALQLDANHGLARNQLVRLYLRRGEYELAVREADDALKRRPGDPRVRLAKAQALTALGRREEALEVLHSIELPPDTSPETRLAIAALYRTNGDHDAARRMIETIPESFQDPRLISELARLDLESGRADEALRRLDRAIALDPENVDLYQVRASLYLTLHRRGVQGAAEKAEQDFKTVLDKDLGRSDAHVALAALFRTLGREDEAVEHYRRALQSDPGNAAVQLSMGTLLEAMGRSEDAMQAYEAAIRLDPELAVAKNNLAWLIANSPEPTPEQLDRALELAREAKQAMPKNPSVTDTLGWVMLRKNLTSAAISLFQEAIEGYPDNPELRALVRYHLAQSYEKNGQPERAIAELRRALAEARTFHERSAAEALLRRLQSS
ncbi:MAG: tetratricopeptide repeat protein [Myxococcota bacterium]